MYYNDNDVEDVMITELEKIVVFSLGYSSITFDRNLK